MLAQTDRWLRLLLLQDYNTRVVLLGTILLGIASGTLGIYLLLRKRALIGDAISHATLPGVAMAFLWTARSGAEKSLLTLLVGAAISGSLGGISVLALRHVAKIREDAALGIVLSVFFGAGVALVSLVQDTGNATGLEAFIYGKAAAMTTEDVWLSGIAACVVVCTALLFGKELKLLCFDAELARSQGWPVLTLDSLLIALVVTVTIVGLQAVGLILIIALLVVPAASARFWTHDLATMTWISALIGAASCASGTLLSAAFARLPSGATIVLCACALFAISFAFGTQRGVVWLATRRWKLRRDQNWQHFLRAVYELLEAKNLLPSFSGELKSTEPVSMRSISELRLWSPAKAAKIASQLYQRELIAFAADDKVQLTPRGLMQAVATTREHRLLEQYMMQQASAEVTQADREADYLEHGLLPEHIAELSYPAANFSVAVPPNPHNPSRDIRPPDSLN